MLVIALLVVGFVAVSRAHADDPSKGAVVAEMIVATWQCQDHLSPGVSVYKRRTAARSPWKHHTARYWVAELNRWTLRRNRCRAKLHARVERWRRINAGIDYYYRTQGRTLGPMSGIGPVVETIGRRYGVQPEFMLATSVTESSMGLAACGYGGFNAWGLGNCDGRWAVPEFGSWAQAFDFYARFLKGMTSVTSGWPNARTTYDYGGYAACSQCWGAATERHMRSIFGVSNSVVYA